MHLRSPQIALSTLIALSLILPATGRQKDEPIKLRTDLVIVDATVTDKDGNFIRNLKAEDFVIYDDGVQRKHEHDLFGANEEVALSRPIAVVFALDISGSIEPDQLASQRRAAESFVKLLTADSLFSVVTFSDEFRVLQDFSNDPAKVGRAFQKIKEVGGGTRLYGALERSVSMLKKAPRFRSNRRLRRVIVVITDGIDSVASPEQPDLIRRLNEAEVTVYSITLPWYSASPNPNQRIMTLLDVSGIVPATGGKDFSADARDFTPAFKAIFEEIRASYTLAYYPPEKNRKDGQVHQIRVECSQRGAIVRSSRTSYQSGK
jgi:VWFA-related protein